MKKILAALVVVGCTALLVPSQLEPESNLTPKADEALVAQECANKKEEPGVADWIVGNHKMPSLHFIDFVELFLR